MPEDTPKVPEEPGEFITPAVFLGKAEEPSAPASGRRSSLRNLRIQLTPEELAQTGVQKLLIEEIARAENEIVELRLFREQFHAVDKENAMFKEKVKTNVGLNILSAVCFAGGGAIVSLSPSIWDAHGAKGIFAVIVGGLFILGGGAALFWTQVKK